SSALDPRLVEHARGDHREEERRVPLARRRMGRHHHGARAADACRAWRIGGVRARSNPCPHRRRPRTREAARREAWTQAEAQPPEQRREAIKRRDEGEETRAEIARRYNVHPSTISRLQER